MATPQVKVPSSGPQPARILILGEAPGKDEAASGKPFVGSSGLELTKIMNEAGILRSEVRISNVCKYRPPGNDIALWWPEKKKDIRTDYHIHKDGEWFDPRIVEGLDELREEVRITQPNVIVPLGNLALWATTRNNAITKWRGSLLKPDVRTGLPQEIKVIPTIHPAAILRQWDWRYLAVHDFRRVKRWETFTGYPEIKENFLVRPNFDVARNTLEELLLRVQREPTLLAVDIETTRRHLACIGIAWSKSEAICLPFTRQEGGIHYWSEDDEFRIIMLLRTLLTHSNARCIGQNWQYDYQYIAKYWGFEVNLFLDIMSEHHVQFPGLPKGLDFQSSLYRDIHIYWKDEGKEMGKGDEVTWWTYNCRDCCATFEIAEVLLAARKSRNLRETIYGSPYEIQQRLSAPVARASARGVRVDHKLRTQTAFMLQEDVAEAERWLNRILGRDFNCRSTKQMQELFYGELQQEKILHRKTHRPTLNDEALDAISNRDPILRVLCSSINHIRSLSNCLSVCLQPLDSDGRLRCQYSIPGTETYRFASSSDPFGFGTNLQNVTSGDRAGGDFPLPNLRKLITPDEGYILGEFDLPQADARVVAWEAQDEKLIELLLDPNRHLHMENAEIIYGKKLESKHDVRYYYAKQGVHLTNYGGTAGVLARTIGITVREAEAFQNRYFSERPKIKEWHKRILMELASRRYVENAYGYRRFYFDRLESLLKEALAWIPQSTVAIATNLGILQVVEDAALQKENVQFLLQVHDSSVFQWPVWKSNKLLPIIQEKLTITVPYPKPLIFKGGAKLSTKSWGDCEEIK